MVSFIMLLMIAFLCSGGLNQENEYNVTDKNGFGRTFEGIGGLSGGASSKLLINYQEPQRSQILDYLFKPNFGASLQILKVEIGGDDQSTDGTEPSHMHEEWEENYNRGYEWWLMLEAKKRNPKIKLYGLPWAFPRWIGGQPYEDLNKTAGYIIKWILGAKAVHNLTIDYIGIWNERTCNYSYIVTLRNLLNQNDLQHVQIIACDGHWQDFNNNQTILDSIYAIGAHYPGTYASSDAMATNKTLWSSEDYSTYNDDVGAGCWARILNQNYVNGYMTSTISWSLIASYYLGLPYQECGLMTAVQPWSNNYEVKNPIWITAHTTQFTDVGWKYLEHNSGVGLLSKGGSYVTLISPDANDLTLIIETMSHDHSVCVRPSLPPYDIENQDATFIFDGSFLNLTHLYLYRTQLRFGSEPSIPFVPVGVVNITNNKLTMNLDIDNVYTLSTLNTGLHGQYGLSPDPKVFSLPYSDNFQNYNVSAEPYNLAAQAGTWEIVEDNNELKFARQTVLTDPVAWCQVLPRPIAVIGDFTWRDIEIIVDVRFPSVNHSDSFFIAAQIPTAPTGCQYTSAFDAIFFWFDIKNASIRLTRDFTINSILLYLDLGTAAQYDVWYTLTLNVKQYDVSASLYTVNQTYLLHFVLPDDAIQNGFAAIGSGSYGYTDIRYLHLSSPYSSSSQSTSTTTSSATKFTTLMSSTVSSTTTKASSTVSTSSVSALLLALLFLVITH